MVSKCTKPRRRTKLNLISGVRTSQNECQGSGSEVTCATFTQIDPHGEANMAIEFQLLYGRRGHLSGRRHVVKGKTGLVDVTVSVNHIDIGAG